MEGGTVEEEGKMKQGGIKKRKISSRNLFCKQSKEYELYAKHASN